MHSLLLLHSSFSMSSSVTGLKLAHYPFTTVKSSLYVAAKPLIKYRIRTRYSRTDVIVTRDVKIRPSFQFAPPQYEAASTPKGTQRAKGRITYKIYSPLCQPSQRWCQICFGCSREIATFKTSVLGSKSLECFSLKYL